jgi:hypothetical protein
MASLSWKGLMSKISSAPYEALFISSELSDIQTCVGHEIVILSCKSLFQTFSLMMNL